MRILANLLLIWGWGILGLVVVVMVAAGLLAAYENGGLRTLAVAVAFFSAAPAIFLGMWLKYR
jgi:hypothetical protein